MADFKLNGITPDGVGKIKLGSVDVQEIYMGSTLVWPSDTPAPDPGQVQICDLIWTDVNSSETELISGGNIPIIDNQTDWYSAWQAQTPAACYRDFDSNNASYGLIYNYFARSLVKPPVGFRLPTDNDFAAITTEPCFTGSNFNRYGANPGVWDPSQLTDTTELGDSGFNSQGFGYGRLNQFSSVVSFQYFGEREAYWRTTTFPGTGFLIQSNGILGGVGFGAATTWMLFIRFVKDA